VVSMCDYVCDVNFLCNTNHFNSECDVANPIIMVATALTVFVALAKLFMLFRCYTKTVLLKLLLNHAYSDLLMSLVIFVVFNPTLIHSANAVTIVIFYGNVLNCVFTIQIFLYGYLKIRSSTIKLSQYIEDNINKIILLTYFGCMILALVDQLLMKEIQQSPYILVGIGGFLILFIDVLIFFKYKK
jgi:hypothetical protein